MKEDIFDFVRVTFLKNTIKPFESIRIIVRHSIGSVCMYS